MVEYWKDDSCEAMRAYYAAYSVPHAATLWCGVPEEDIELILEKLHNFLTQVLSGRYGSILKYLVLNQEVELLKKV